MTWTYTADPENSDRDAVRLLIGDTDSTDQQLQDAEITYFLSQQGDPYRAAALAARSLASKYARQVSSAIDSVRVEAGEQYRHYLDLASRLDASATRNASTGIGVPFVGGISEAAMDTADVDTDRVQPLFTRTLFSNPPGGNDAINDAV